MVIRLFSSLIVCLFVSHAKADFGEIDIMVGESLAKFFDGIDSEVDLTTREYSKNFTVEESLMKVFSSVKAWNGASETWLLYQCTTEIQILSPGHYEDLGSACYIE